MRETPIGRKQLRVGRSIKCDLQLLWSTISGQHADFITTEQGVLVRDLGSTNGTFVNGNRISEDTYLSNEDIIQIGNAEFRLGCRPIADGRLSATRQFNLLPSRLVGFESLVQGIGLPPFYQPIVMLKDTSLVGFEMLVGSELPEFPGPREMFEIAQQIGQEDHLSQACRAAGVEQATGMPVNTTLFLNTHPAELLGTGLMESLETLRKSIPDQFLSLEIHEAAVTDLYAMAELRKKLSDLNIGLAYDDFGAGQARLLDLVEVPPDILKFDMSLVRDLHKASQKHYKMIEALVKLVRELGISPLAEGIEKPAEASVCLEAGFELAQGFNFGRPNANWQKYVESN